MNQRQKSQNVGLLYEGLSIVMAEALVNGDQERYAKSKTIAMKHFALNTDLGKELRYFRVLHEQNTHDGPSLLKRVKEKVCQLNGAILSKQKIAFNEEVRKELAEEKHVSSRVKSEDPMFCNIQNLFNEWRLETIQENLSTVVDLENKVLVHLARKDLTRVTTLEDLKTPGVNSLLLKVLAEKINTKYGTALTESQRDIIKNIGDKPALARKLNGERRRFSSLLEKSIQDPEFDQIIKGKLSEVKTLLEHYSGDALCSPDSVKFHLSLSRLEKELRD